MSFCNGSHTFSFGDRCVRTFWGSILPTVFVFVFCLFRLPVPKFAHKFLRIIKTPFKPFLTILEAEALDANSNFVGGIDDLAMQMLKTRTHFSLSCPIVFSLVGLVETLSWLSYGSFLLISVPTNAWDPYQPFFVAVSWLYTVIRPIVRPPATPPFDLFSIYCLHFIAGTVQLGGTIFDNQVFGTPFPSTFGIITLVMNLAIVLALLAILVAMPLAMPSNRVRQEEIVSRFQCWRVIICFRFFLVFCFHAFSARLTLSPLGQGYSVSPEDYSTLWGWITFSWVYPLIRRVCSFYLCTIQYN
jgi:hypothetical protein